MTDMVLTEFNEEEYIEMVKKECLEIGEKRGFEIGEKRGLEIGEKRGLETGKKEIILEMIKEGIISPETGAEKLGVSVDELGI